MFQDTGRAVRQIESRSMTGMAGAGMMLPALLQGGGQLILSILGFSTRIFGRSEYLAYGIPAALLGTLFFFFSGLAILMHFNIPGVILSWFDVEMAFFDPKHSVGAAIYAVFVALMAPFVMYCAFYIKAHYKMESMMARGYQLSWWLTPIVVVSLFVWAKVEAHDPKGVLYDYRQFMDGALILLILSSGLIAFLSFLIARNWSRYSTKQKAVRNLDVAYTVEVDQYINEKIHECEEQARLYARYHINKWGSFMMPLVVVMLGIFVSYLGEYGPFF